MLGRWITGLKCFDGLFVGCSVNRGTEPKNWGISVPENQEPNKNRFSRFRFFQFWLLVLSVRFSVLGFSCPSLAISNSPRADLLATHYRPIACRRQALPWPRSAPRMHSLAIDSCDCCRHARCARPRRAGSPPAREPAWSRNPPPLAGSACAACSSDYPH
jgi:hypothetical protein